MAYQIANNLRFRRSFGRIRKIIDLPYLIEIQKNSYELFLQKDAPPTQRQNLGLQEVFRSVFPIKDFNETASLEFVSYSLGEPKYDVEECHQRGMTFAAPLKVTVQLVLWDVDSQTGSRSIKNVKEQEVYFGEIPLMTANGTFMVNGTERVIVSQLHRSPGVFFEHDKGKTHASGKLLYSARVIPYRGSWVDLEFDPRDILYVRIDRRRKFHATVLLRALGMTAEDLLNYYYRSDTIVFDGRKPALVFNPNHLLGGKVGSDVRDPKTNELIVKEGKKFTRPVLRQMEASRIKHVPMAWEELFTALQHGVVDGMEGSILNIYFGKMYEVQKHLSFSAHNFGVIPLLISESAWKKLPSDQQVAVVKAGDEAKLYIRKQITDSEDRYLKDMKAKGLQVNEVDKAAFREAATGVYKHFEPQFGKETLKKVLDYAEAIRAKYPEIKLIADVPTESRPAQRNSSIFEKVKDIFG